MFFKNNWIIILFIGLASGCSNDENKVKSIPEVNPTAIEQVLKEIEELLLHVNKSLLVIGSTDIESYATPQSLECTANTCRSEVTLGSIVLKKVFKYNSGVISAVHYDFYYDSLSPDLEKDTQTAISLVHAKLGDYNSTYSSSSMKTYSWANDNNIIDYELFDNGFTFTIRKNQIAEKTIEAGLVAPKHIELAQKLIQCVHSDSLKLGLSVMADIQNLFRVGFKSKPNVLAFTETYNENILLSGSFLFEQENLSGVYFDYVYSDTTSNEFLTDVKTTKLIINKLYGMPSEVVTVSLSTSYRWNNTLIALEVYGDGFSVFLEENGL